jgi:flagellar assembly protein FliH
MSINTDGHKKTGKFLKKNSKIMKSVQMTQYSFVDLSKAQNIEFDNLERSIIHTKFHSPEELAKSIREPESLKEALVDPSRPPMAIIMPGDFTQDWLNEKLSNKRRLLGFEDEDDFDDQFSLYNASKVEKKAALLKSEKAAARAEAKISVSPAEIQSVLVSDSQAQIPPDELLKKARPVSIVQDPYSQKIAVATELASEKIKSAVKGDEQAAFIPLDQSSSQVENAEAQAIAAYKHIKELEAVNSERLESLKSEAKSNGYNEGFRIGEEKGVLAGQKTSSELFAKVTELLKEFAGLKRNVLENIQKNFFELSQAVAEALLEREFSIRPEAFVKVLEKVLKDTVTDDQFKIRLHPDTWQKVSELKIPEMEGHLIKDPAIAVGEFKVESNLTVVDGSVKKIIAQMLQNVDVDLFDETKAAG